MMIRENISPKTNQITINIPANMVNQELELLVFTVGEKQKKQAEKKKTISLMEKVFNKAGSLNNPCVINIDKMMNDMNDALS